MLPSVVYFAFAYCSMLRVLLPFLRLHPSVGRARLVLLSLRFSSLPAVAINAYVTIADAATPWDRNDPAAIDDADALRVFQRRCSQQRVLACRRRNTGRHRRRMYGTDWSAVPPLSPWRNDVEDSVIPGRRKAASPESISPV